MKEIYKRRSVRIYNDKKISDNDIIKLVKAGMNAPSAHNLRPISFLVISDRKHLEYLSEINKYGKMLKTASHAIIVCAREKTEYWPQEAGAATQNILLEATSLGIGSCWIGLYPKKEEDDIRAYFKIPTDVRAVSIISLGYPVEDIEENNFYDKERVHFNEWR